MVIYIYIYIYIYININFFYHYCITFYSVLNYIVTYLYSFALKYDLKSLPFYEAINSFFLNLNIFFSLDTRSLYGQVCSVKLKKI